MRISRCVFWVSWFLLVGYGKWSHWRENNLVLSGPERDNVRLPWRTLLNNFFLYFCSRKYPYKLGVICSVEHLLLIGHVTEMHGHMHTLPTAHLKDKNWASVRSYHPCQGWYFGNACTAKGLWIWAVVLWLLVLPASPCTSGFFLECQLCVQSVGCSWDCKGQLLLLNGT